jgi:hypothetical protein
MKGAGTPHFFSILECDFKTHQQQAKDEITDSVF